MATFSPNPSAVLKKAGSAVADAVVDEITCSLNDGWTWKGRIKNLTLDPYESVSTAYTIDFQDGLGNSRSTPDLVLADVDQFGQYNVRPPQDETSIGGDDKTSYLMRKPNQSFPSYRAVYTGDVISALEARAGVTINGDPNLYIIEEDIKHSLLSDALNRILNVAGMDYRIASDNQVYCTNWETTGGTLVFPHSTLIHSVKKRQLYTGLRVGKQSSIPFEGSQKFAFDTPGFRTATLAVPITAVGATNLSNGVDGNVGSLTFYNASDEWIWHFDFTSGSWPEPSDPRGDTSTPATYIIANVIPTTISGGQTRAVVEVFGTPEDTLPAGVDAEFLNPEADGDLGERPAPDFIDPLFPSESYALSRRPYILAKLNSAADQLVLTGPLRAASAVDVNLAYTYNTRSYKSLSVRWDFRSNQTTVLLGRV